MRVHFRNETRTAVESRAAKDGSDGVDDPLVRLLDHGHSLPRAGLRYEPAQHVGLSVSLAEKLLGHVSEQRRERLRNFHRPADKLSGI
ncbi:hypothetical protein [Sphingomonas sp.]|jgi:hypothetical protein|uniref:hypothetical protein n=1 Tax=Sphingomonas sp. TaxID=28214 RepID=UPI00262F7D97|nr:hypothetical protein [Sphingomonas sp.]MDF2496329.1 hypothetical protein [Sphingomonas sp.]